MKYGKGIFAGAVTAVLGAKSIAFAQFRARHRERR